jgi:L-aminopeptidase/D-esterase-like protein
MPKGANLSCDMFFAFSTAAHIPRDASVDHYSPTMIQNINAIDTNDIDALFGTVADPVEEATCNVLTSAESLAGFRWRGQRRICCSG